MRFFPCGQWTTNKGTGEGYIHRLAVAAPDLLDALYVAKCFVEDAEHDPAYKEGAVRKVLRQIDAAIDRAENGD